jgi:hypothetical protein
MLVKNMYTEAQLIEMVSRLAKIYLESYPDDKESLERFLRWSYSQWGYEYDGEKHN